MYRKILVPYDLSKPADSALKHALELAKAVPDDSSAVILLHVIPEIPIYPVLEHAVRSRKTGRTTSFDEHIKFVYTAMKVHSLEILDEKKREYEQLEKTKKIRTEVIQGSPVDKILEYAEREGIGLIVIGSTGLSGIASLKALGSVSRGVLERSKCPVMIVRN